MLEQSHTGFPDTRWSMIDRLAKGTDDERQKAAEYLAEVYWPAVYSFLRQTGKNQNEASELTQAFFCDVVFHRRLFERADAAAGSLRFLVLRALKHYVIDQRRRNAVALRHWRLNNEQMTHEDGMIQGDRSPEDAFVRRWAVAVLEDAIRRCEDHFAKSGKKQHWSAFETRILCPSIMMHAPPTYEKVASEHGFRDVTACITAVRVVRKRLMAMIRQVVAESANDAEVQKAEFQDILALMEKPRR